ncbi:DUF4124 domain-containing protein [Coralloluteibacterium stylophorae]|uniref:DUF4124 domain-containing protein n=1 Tax=Coralloluteibacterium stylophorae TaxID=1776034 RepID=A0AAP2CFG6_9GAMM|nr:DUF4124 domain-containing protein [Coralloluteibacterium stylophorae]MBS7458991.1 DUF4124 domain-containing protein [Coralloluteibacterium stylophorae]
MRTIATCIALALAAGAASAADQKLYRWVDEAGEVHYSDHLPPEEIDRARREISFTSGLAVGEVDRALTEEERTALAAEQARRAAEAASEDAVRQRDDVLLGSYPSEDDLRRAYDERAALLAETLKATRIGIDAQRQSLNSLLGHAADLELAGKPVNVKTLESLRAQREQLDQQLAALHDRETEQAALDLEYRDTVARYRELRDGAAQASSDS